MKYKKLKDILDMEYYLEHECYCPGEIYSFDGFFKRKIVYEKRNKTL